jgi:hypothetical protein
LPIFSRRCFDIVIVSKRNGRNLENVVVAVVAPIASRSSRPVPQTRSLIRSARERVFSVRYR